MSESNTPRRVSGGATVEGSMLAADISDSSDGEVDVLPNTAVKQLSLDFNYSALTNEDDGEIEYGEAGKPSTFSSSNEIKPLLVELSPEEASALAAASRKTRLETPNLIGLMEDSVRETEEQLRSSSSLTVSSISPIRVSAAGASSLPVPPSRKKLQSKPAILAMDLGNESSKNDRVEVLAVDGRTPPPPPPEAAAIGGDSSDMFGIVYKPMPRGVIQAADYSLPRGPAFKEEKEFEREMSSEFAVPISAKVGTITVGEDEFDYDDDITASGEVNAASMVEEIRKQLQEKQRSLETSILDSVRSESVLYDTDGDADLTYVSAGKHAPQESPLDVNALLMGASTTGVSSLGELVDVYGRGLGDVEVRGLAAANHNGAVEKEKEGGQLRENINVKAPLASQIIEEEDEDCEQDEIEVERQEEIQQTKVTVAARAVEKEWEEIEALQLLTPKGPPVTSTSSSTYVNGADDADDIEASGPGGTVNRRASATTFSELTSLCPSISVEEAMKLSLEDDLSVYRPLIVPTEFVRSGIAKWTGADPKLAFPQAEERRDEVFLLAQVHYSPSIDVHRRMLQTIYRGLTGDDTTVLDLGSHWEVIGFQGNDPRTDLNRSQGILSLLQVLALIEDHPKVAKELSSASRSPPPGDWPFMCVSIGFTKEAIAALRRGAIYPECNKCGSVFSALADAHRAQFFEFRRRFQKNPSVHHAFHLAKVREGFRKDPGKFMKSMKEIESKKHKRSSSNDSVSSSGEWGSIVGELLSPCSSNGSGGDSPINKRTGGTNWENAVIAKASKKYTA